jgi:hypothetical protein
MDAWEAFFGGQGHRCGLGYQLQGSPFNKQVVS